MSNLKKYSVIFNATLTIETTIKAKSLGDAERIIIDNNSCDYLKNVQFKTIDDLKIEELLEEE